MTTLDLTKVTDAQRKALIEAGLLPTEKPVDSWKTQARASVQAVLESHPKVKDLQGIPGFSYHEFYNGTKFAGQLSGEGHKWHNIALQVRQQMAEDGISEDLSVARMYYAYAIHTASHNTPAKTAKTGKPAKTQATTPASQPTNVTLDELIATRTTLVGLGLSTGEIDAKIAAMVAGGESEPETETTVSPIILLAQKRAERNRIAATAKTGNQDVDRFIANHFGGGYWDRVAAGEQEPSAHFAALAEKWANGEATDDHAVYEIKPATTSQPETAKTETRKPASKANAQASEPANGNGKTAKEAKYHAFLASLPTFLTFAKKHGKVGEWVNDTQYTGDRSIAILKDGKLNERWLRGEVGSDVHKAYVAANGTIQIK